MVAYKVSALSVGGISYSHKGKINANSPVEACRLLPTRVMKQLGDVMYFVVNTDTSITIVTPDMVSREVMRLPK